MQQYANAVINKQKYCRCCNN